MYFVSSTILNKLGGELNDLLFSKQNFTTFLGAFLGAFFAFCFFILSEHLKRKGRWKNTYKNEHAYLERYFYDLHDTITFNKKILQSIIDDYKNKSINLTKLMEVPIREDSSMKVDDQLFINKIEIYIAKGLKRLNAMQDGIGKVQDQLNEDLLEENSIKKKRAGGSLNGFLHGAENMIKFYDFFLEIIDELIIENRLLLKRYKKWKVNLRTMDKTYRERKKDIKELRKAPESEITNPVANEYLDRLKKFGLYEENNKEK